MGTLNYDFTLANDTDADADEVMANFNKIRTLINGNIDGTNIADSTITSAKIVDGTIVQGDLSAALLAQLATAGINAADVRRGKSAITTAEARSNTSYGLLTTPDRVQNVVLPTDGLIFVAYHARFESSVSGAGRAAIFLDSTQLKADNDLTSNPAVQEAQTVGASNATALVTCSGGLIAAHDADTEVSTGQALGGWVDVTDPIAGSDANGVIGGVCPIFAAADTYDVSVQFKATSGSVTADDRRLWVWTMGF